MEVGRRAAVAGVYHILAFLVVRFLTPYPGRVPDSIDWIGAALVVTMLGRIALGAIQARRFSDPIWRARWKWKFRGLILLTALFWGLLSLSVLWSFGVSLSFFIVTLVNVGVAALSVQNLGLDLLLVRLFVPLIGGIPLLGLLFRPETGSGALAGVLALFLAYLLFLARRAHQLLWEALANRSELEETRTKAIESARLAAMGTMAGGIAHEINNPLQVIRTYTQLLSNPPQNAAPDTAIVAARIDQTVERIAHIIASLRAFARPGTGDPFEQVKVGDLLAEVAELARLSRPAEAIRLELGPVSESLTVECRKTEIGQVVINLLNNAFDAVEVLQEKWVRINVVDCGRTIEIEVEDSGPGIPRELLDKIMLPFFTTKIAQKGIGLGLSISATIVEQHGGKLWVDTKSPHTRFVISLPKRQK